MRVTDPLGKTDETRQYVHVKTHNTPPTCRITAPEDGVPSNPNNPLLLEGFAHDVDLEANQLTAYWSSDRDGEIGIVHPELDGTLALEHEGMSPGLHILQLIVEDERGEYCIDYVSHVVGTPPTVILTSPRTTKVYNVGDPVPIQAMVSDELDSPYEIDLAWEDNDGRFSDTRANSSGQVSFEYDGFRRGAQTLTVTATNEIGMSSTDSVTFRMNGAPTAPTIQITPSTPDTHASLGVNMSIASTDPDSDPITYRYQWQKDGTAASSSSSIPSSDTQKGETWTVSVTPNDGFMDGPAAVASVLIQNSKPSLSSATISPNPAYANDTLTCTGYGFFDPDEPALRDPDARYAFSFLSAQTALASDNDFPPTRTR